MLFGLNRDGELFIPRSSQSPQLRLESRSFLQDRRNEGRHVASQVAGELGAAVFGEVGEDRHGAGVGLVPGLGLDGEFDAFEPGADAGFRSGETFGQGPAPSLGEGDGI